MAGRSLGTLTLDLIARIGGFQSGMDQAARIADSRAKKINQTMTRLGKTVAGAFAAIGGTLLIRKIIEATNAQEQALAQVEQGIKSTGGAAGYSAQELEKMAAEMQKVSTYGDEAILTAQSLLLSFTAIKGDNFRLATEAVLDLATRMGTDLKSAALLVGKALSDPAKRAAELSRSGIVLTEQQKDLIKSFQATGQMAKAQGVILKELSVEFGGSARAARDTFSGALAAAQNALGDLLEGSKGDGLLKTTMALNEFTQLLQDPRTVEQAQILIQQLIGGLGTIINLVGEASEGIESLLGNASKDYKLQLELEFLESKDLEYDLSGFNTDIPIIFNFGYVEGGSIIMGPEEIKNRIAEIKAELAGLDFTPQGFTGGRGGARRSTQPQAPLPPTEDYLKQAAALEKQIALFGKTGKAAEIAYDIAHEGLGDMRPDEEQRILRLTQTLDALAAQADSIKKLQEEQDKLNQLFVSQEAEFTAQIDLASFRELNDISNELTELEKLRFEIQYGALKELSPEQAARLEQLAAEVDAINAITKAQEDAKEAQEEWARVYESVRTPVEALADELARLNALYNQSGMTEEDAETLRRASTKAVEEFKKATEEVNKFAEEATRNVQDILADFLVDPFSKGLDGLVEDFGRMLQQMAAQAIAADIAGKIFGSGGLGSGTGWIDSAFDFFGGLFADEGGRASPGQTYRIGVAAQPELFIPDASKQVIQIGQQLTPELFTPQVPGTFVPAHKVMERVRDSMVFRETQQLFDDLTGKRVSIDETSRRSSESSFVRNLVDETSRQVSESSVVRSVIEDSHAILTHIESLSRSIEDETVTKRVLDEVRESRRALIKIEQVFGNLLGFAAGGYAPPNRLIVTGERGPEFMFSGPAGATIINNRESFQLVKEMVNPYGVSSRDIGGRGLPGEIYQIGSGAQPEWFIPDQPGTFVPSEDIGGVTNVNHFNFTIQAPAGTVSRSTEQQIAAAAARGLAQASRRNS